MTPIDYTIIGIVVLSALLGVFRGLLREVLTLLTLLIALWAAWHFADALLPVSKAMDAALVGMMEAAERAGA